MTDEQAKARAAAEEDWTSRAALVVAGLSNALTSRGWGVVILSIARRVELPGGDRISPGSTILLVEPGLEPALPAEARTLRKMADELDRMFRESGAREAERSFIEELTGPWSTPGPGKPGL